MSVLVIMEQHNGSWNRMSWEALAGGIELGKLTGQPVSIAVAGSGIAALAAEAAQKNVAKVYAADHPALAEYTADGLSSAIEQLIRTVNPSFVVFPHTYEVRDFAPKVATRFKTVLVADVVAIRTGPVFVRQLFQGKLNADFKVKGEGPCFLSIQAGAFRADSLESGSAPVENVAVTMDAGAIRNKPEAPFRESSRAVDLTAAEIIVSVGRGIKEKDNIHIVEELAKALGGELAASRPICDSGWLPMERQVGSSGQTVAPKVYVAVGISGAIQHLEIGRAHV